MDNKEKIKIILEKLNNGIRELNDAKRKIGFIESNISKNDVLDLEIAIDEIKEIENKLYDYYTFEN